MCITEQKKCIYTYHNLNCRCVHTTLFELRIYMYVGISVAAVLAYAIAGVFAEISAVITAVLAFVLLAAVFA